MKARLETIPELAGNVVVYRRSDIESQLESRMAKSKGKCVIVRLIAGKNESKSDASFFTGKYTVSLFTVPILSANDAKDADDLLGEIEAKLNKWWPSDLPSNKRMFLKSEDIAFVDAPEFDIVQLTLKSPLAPLQLTDADTDWDEVEINWEDIS